ncbi:putative protein N(5)-glutamine methyltransferase [Streptomyces zingiberis]|uniref:peptide chain release factor N(5)-glutamine methyltransferase n=1 Tax=Streptomyces zingiberis TaxID=2053010 RepID=A0ABX1BV28_9ACTN|nr:putative protein N(5)-glutamine methyltransferase [Streptomyces zingiberis]NJQ00395.1 putative protein N(5)-glutamine methyltransferase [Streptomyces zingiberis]
MTPPPHSPPSPLPSPSPPPAHGAAPAGSPAAPSSPPGPAGPGFAGVTARLRAAGCVFAEDEAHLLLAAAADAGLAALVERRAAGEPLEHVLGWAEFCGLRVAVGPGVFVPRRRTEFLARRAAAGLAPPNRSTGAPPVVVDLCCGSGAVGAAVAALLGAVELHAADIDPVALRYARRNLAAAGGRVHEGDLYAPLPGHLRGRVDVLVVNAPYVPTGSLGLLPAEAREHEPQAALDGGPDGLDVQRRVAAGAAGWLAPGGRLLMETGTRQAAGTAAVFARGGLAVTVAHCEETEATVVTGTRPGR